MDHRGDQSANHESALAERPSGWGQMSSLATKDPRAVCLHELFESQVVRTPDAVAVESQGEQWTFEEINTRANQLARHLTSIGAGPESRVGVCLRRCPDMVVGLLG